MAGLDGRGPLGRGSGSGWGMGICNTDNTRRGSFRRRASYGRRRAFGRNFGGPCMGARGFGFARNIGYNQGEAETDREFLKEQKEFLEERLEFISEQLKED